MNPKSAKNKGNRLENFICREIEKEGLGKATRTPGSGSGLTKGDIFSNLKFTLEAKNHKSFSLGEWVNQVKNDAKIGSPYPNKWAVIFRDYRYPEFKQVYATIDFWEFLGLLKSESGALTENPDREMRFELKDIKMRSNTILRRLNSLDLKGEDRKVIWEIEDFKQRIQEIIKKLKI